MSRTQVLRLRAILENIPQAMDCVAESARTAGLDENMTQQIQIAVDEACANVVAHAYSGMEPGDMEVVCRLDGKDFTIQVRDWGRSFEPDHVEIPDVTAPLEERSLGGLGLFLIRQFMDDVEFTFDPERGNELTMTKRVKGAE